MVGLWGGRRESCENNLWLSRTWLELQIALFYNKRWLFFFHLSLDKRNTDPFKSFGEGQTFLLNSLSLRWKAGSGSQWYSAVLCAFMGVCQKFSSQKPKARDIIPEWHRLSEPTNAREREPSGWCIGMEGTREEAAGRMAFLVTQNCSMVLLSVVPNPFLNSVKKPSAF